MWPAELVKENKWQKETGAKLSIWQQEYSVIYRKVLAVVSSTAGKANRLLPKVKMNFGSLTSSLCFTTGS